AVILMLAFPAWTLSLHCIIGRPIRTTQSQNFFSELFHPRPHLDLPCPGAARLAQEIDEGLRDGVGVKQAIGPVRRHRPALTADAAVDHHMTDVNAERG